MDAAGASVGRWLTATGSLAGAPQYGPAEFADDKTLERLFNAEPDQSDLFGRGGADMSWYAEQRRKLDELVQVLDDKALRIRRFVRVAFAETDHRHALRRAAHLLFDLYTRSWWVRRVRCVSSTRFVTAVISI